MVSQDIGEFETLVLGTRIVLNDFFYLNFFYIDPSKVIPYKDGASSDIFKVSITTPKKVMDGAWPDIFEVLITSPKKVDDESGTDLCYLCPMSLYFENRSLDHMIATTLVPHKIFLSNITTRDLTVLYCLINKYRLN